MKNKESWVVLYLVNELFAVLFMSELFITCPVSANYPKGSSMPYGRDHLWKKVSNLPTKNTHVATVKWGKVKEGLPGTLIVLYINKDLP